MILDELTVHNFGVYGGRQSIALTPTSREKPVILFGGLNGGGKTTLVDALQLCLYGNQARSSNRNGLAYEDYLRRCVHRGADAPEAAIHLAFRHRSQGVEQRFDVHRSWSVTNAGTRERFHVLRDGRLDRLATDGWAEQVEDFIPARIAHLFLFDGEKVEGYADLAGASGLVATAVHSLLGLDVVERLVADLGVLERRKRTDAKQPGERRALEAASAEVAELDRTRRKLVQERAAAETALDRALAALSAADERLRREGGDAYDRRGMLEGAVDAGRRRIEAVGRDLGELAAGASPLLMVADLVAGVAAREAVEAGARAAREAIAILEEEHREIAGLPELANLTEGARRRLERSLSERLERRRAISVQPLHLDLSPEGRGGLAALIGVEFPAAQDRLGKAIMAEAESRRALDEAEHALAAVPSRDAIASAIDAREAARRVVESMTSEQLGRSELIAALDRELAQVREREARLAEAEARDRFAREDVARLLSHSTRARGTLGRFRDAVVVRHVGRIERLVLESFHRLVRKRSLVAELRIDPRTFALELRGGDGRQVTTDRLSAGERQLLTIAILWGLARASGRPLPTVIDTPLGRLDSEHRSHLVRRYFPHASHQVILLSTDEEIAGRYHEELRASVGRSYRLRFDEARGSTVVEDGYLGDHVDAR